jgi:hypothetical protein
MRLIVFVLLCFNATLAGAEVACEQLAQIAAATVKMRNQGEPLAAVLAQAGGMEASGKYTAADVALVKVVIQASFNSEHSPNDILAECRAQRQLGR